MCGGDGNWSTSQEFAVPETCVCDRWGRKDEIFANKLTLKGFNGQKESRFPAIQENFVAFMLRQRTDQKPFTTEHLKVRPTQLVSQKDLVQMNFKASRFWIINLMKKCGFSL